MIDVTLRAEQEILRTLDSTPPAANGDRLVGIYLKLVNNEPVVEYIYHFLGNQNHIAGESLTVGINTLENCLSKFADYVIDWDGKFIVRKNVEQTV